jgi:RNA polymerase sigma-70 factor, ECF subfamily
LPKGSGNKGKQNIQRAAAWSEVAFKEVYSRYIKPLHAYILRRVRNHHDAEDLKDLTAQVFLQVLDRLDPKEASSPKLAAWLFASARNATANFTRRRSRVAPIPIDELPESADDSYPGAALLDEEELARLLGAISDLPDERRRAIILRFVECLPHSEIADALGRTEGSARVLVHRTLADLRREVS